MKSLEEMNTVVLIPGLIQLSSRGCTSMNGKILFCVLLPGLISAHLPKLLNLPGYGKSDSQLWLYM